MALIDLTGKRFGKLTVLRRSGSTGNGYGATTPTWLTRCTCGKTKVIAGPNLRRGLTRSCGCLPRPHGMFGTPEYSAWTTMIQRCTNPKAGKFPAYGAVGITVCPKWRRSFKAFLTDLGVRPGKGYSLDRIDGTKGYHPNNVRWATIYQQNRNKRTNRVITAFGVTQTLVEWAIATKIGQTTIRERLQRGWAPERAVTAPTK
jgi:hypothetical protein